jgi:hypothetical protein
MQKLYLNSGSRSRAQIRFVDGAARIADPIIAGFNTGEHVWGEVFEGLQADGLVKHSDFIPALKTAGRAKIN